MAREELGGLMAHEKWKCSDCDTFNSVDNDKCLCGNVRPMYVSTGSGSSHGGCSIPGCPMPGGMSASFGANARWYCRWHFGYKDDPGHWSRITEELKQNRPKISGCKPNGEYVNNPVPVLAL